MMVGLFPDLSIKAISMQQHHGLPPLSLRQVQELSEHRCQFHLVESTDRISNFLIKDLTVLWDLVNLIEIEK